MKNILGMQLVTHQTGPQGQKVQRLLIEETAAIDRELYLGHRARSRAAGSSCLWRRRPAAWRLRRSRTKTPEAIFKEDIDPAVGFGRGRRASWRSRWG